MLYKETVDRPTLGILKQLMEDPALDRFALVGGTALALRIGHRKSIDLDLFTSHDFNQSVLSEHIGARYGFFPDFIAENTLKGFIDNVAIDLIAHKYPWVGKVEVSEGIRMATLEDIAAMKLNAIIHNGTRAKDFIDIAFLGERLSFDQMARAFETKYSANPLIAPKALLYHEDIDHSVEIDLLRMPYDFSSISTALKKIVDFPKVPHQLSIRRGIGRR